MSSLPTEPAVEARNLTHKYGDRTALRKVSMVVSQGSLFGIVGPNGSGKSTLFRILSTLQKPTDGSATVLGSDTLAASSLVRQKLGVVFQNSILDGKLTLRENLLHHGQYYGLGGRRLRERVDAALGQLRLADRAKDKVETLSGGMRRRGELAGCLLHEPPVLLLDEPTVGLDPVARRDFWDTITRIRAERSMTILVTTHLMDEAERCDRLALLHQGEVVALASPDELKADMGFDVITIRTTQPDALVNEVKAAYGWNARTDDHGVRIEVEAGHAQIGGLIERFEGRFESITLSKPSIEDVFFLRTGVKSDESGDGA
ncbi:MAG: ABC transporter ATP-binding protein [Candidatus Poribacteria bacterium]|nr:ABC transporter ATP-binding protein [Candidatus Poribacteria bacterium]